MAGGVAVWLGAEGLVRGAVKLAEYLGVPSLIIGLTIVAFGTSAPELVVSVVAAVRGYSQIALGNVIGSNIMNIGLVLGLSALISPVVVQAVVLRRDIPVLLFVTVGVIALVVAGDGISRMDAAIVLAGFAAHTVWSYRLAQKEQARITSVPGWERPELKARHIVYLVGGMAALALGAEGMVRGAVGLADGFGVSKRVIGLTIVAFGTSVPELAASAVAAKHGEGDLAIGNVVGSNLYNLLLILGTSALVRPIGGEYSWSSLDFVFCVIMVLLLFPMIYRGGKIGRVDGGILLAAYALFAWLIIL